MGNALLKDVEYFKANGFSEQQASTLILYQRDLVESHLATKKDIEQLRADTKKDIELVKSSLTIKMGAMIFSSMVIMLGILSYLQNINSQQLSQALKTEFHSALEQNSQKAKNQALTKTN